MATTTMAAKDLGTGDHIIIGRTIHTVLSSANLGELVHLTLSHYVETKHDYVEAEKYLPVEKPVKVVVD